MISSKPVLVIGLGFGQLYVDLLREKGYSVYTLDINPALGANFKTIDEAIAFNKEWFLTIISCPNYLHLPYAEAIGNYSQNILVEKPGFKDLREHNTFLSKYPHCNLHMTKNNYFRQEFIDYSKEQMRIRSNPTMYLVWREENRIPHPGSWFTNKEKAFGGVSRDLLPHLFHALNLFKRKDDDVFDITYISPYKNWHLTPGLTTEYGEVDLNGVYNVDDDCYIEGYIQSNNIESYFTLDVAWKTCSIPTSRYLRSPQAGGHTLNFDLCPVSAYDKMLDSLFFNPSEEMIEKSKVMDLDLMLVYERIEEEIKVREVGK